jgi:2-phosphoglycerate kinase
MASHARRPDPASGAGEGAGRDRLFVEHDSGRRPFMRGILVHSLMARGLAFDDAFAVANAARERLRGRGVVPVRAVAETVDAVLRERHLLEDARPPAVAPAIRVTGPAGAAPFSKGFLSQSLLAAAIEPNDAFDVAREIEGALVLRGRQEIDRHELRRLAYQALERRFGVRTAERYLVWRRFQEPDRPVIVLLGGATGAGKTSLALEVSRRLGIHHVLSTDAIRQIMRIVLSQELVPAIHASSYDAHRVLGRSALGEDPVIEGFLAQASIVSVGVRAMLDRAVAENSSLILDGVSIVPGLLDLSAYRDTAHVIFLVVATLDVAAFRQRFEQRARESQRAPHRYLENLDAILRIQDHFLELAERHDTPIVDNESIDASVLSILKHVCETLRQVGGFDAKALL